MPRVKQFDEHKVLNKAMELFWKQGYAATSFQDLVSHLGINRASIYSTYGDKDQLFKKAFALYRKTNIDELTHFFEARSNVKKAFEDLFEQAIQEATSDADRKGCFVVNTITELTPNDQSLDEVLDANKRAFINEFYKHLKQGKAKGKITTEQDLKALATLLYTLYNGIRVVSKIRPNSKELKDSVRLALSLIQ